MLLSVAELSTALQETQLHFWSYGPSRPVVLWNHLFWWRRHEQFICWSLSHLLPLAGYPAGIKSILVHPSGIKSLQFQVVLKLFREAVGEDQISGNSGVTSGFWSCYRFCCNGQGKVGCVVFAPCCKPAGASDS